MKCWRVMSYLVPVFVCVCCVVLAVVAIGQGVPATIAEPCAYAPWPYPRLLDIVLRSGPLGMIVWLGILLCNIAVLPLGIAAIGQSVRLRTQSIPLPVKLLCCGFVCLLALGGLWFISSVAEITIRYNSGPGEDSTPNVCYVGALANSLRVPLAGCLISLCFLTISVVIIHFKRRKMLAGPGVETGAEQTGEVGE